MISDGSTEPVANFSWRMRSSAAEFSSSNFSSCVFFDACLNFNNLCVFVSSRSGVSWKLTKRSPSSSHGPPAVAAANLPCCVVTSTSSAGRPSPPRTSRAVTPVIAFAVSLLLSRLCPSLT